MSQKGLRYFGLGSGASLTALMLAIDKIPSEAAIGIILLCLGLAGADVKKHWKDAK